MISTFRQIGAVVAMNVRNLPQRLGASVTIVVGIAGVVAVLICVLAMGVGFARTLAGTGDPDRVIVLASGALSETLSSLPRDAAQHILNAPGIRHDTADRPIASAEVLAQIQRPRQSDGKLTNVALRGVGAAEPLLRPELHIIAGRMFSPAVHELIVGRKAQIEYGGLNVGDHLSFQNGDWLVVGTFEGAGGNSHDSELMTDAETLLTAYQRTWFHSITARLDGAGAAQRTASLQRLKQALAADPTLHVDVRLENEYFAAQSRGLSALLRLIGYFVGGVMAVGAVFGALNTLYAAVSARSIEIATLRAIGFGATAMVISVLSEALLLALAGAALGALCAWAFFDGHTMSMISGAQSQLAFAITVTPALVVLGIIWAAVIGLVGGLLPALRAARIPVATAPAGGHLI